jgi:predicted outer membrane repeat protein
VVEELLTPVRRALPFALALVVVAPIPAGADAVTFCDRDDRVGPGSLDAALAAGGVVTFSCNTPATIQMTKTHRLAQSVTIDGGDASRITLDGGGRTLSMFQVAVPSISVSLAGLTIKRAIAAPLGHLSAHVHGSVIDTGLQNGPSVELRSLEIRECSNPVTIRGSYEPARLVVRNTRFADNKGNAIEVSGEADIARSSFLGNESALWIAGRAAGLFGVAKVHDNVSFATHLTSAVRVSVGGIFEATDATFTDNRGSDGGAIRINGRAIRATLKKVSFEGNTATGSGGAVAVEKFVQLAPVEVHTGPVVLSLTYATFARNRAARGGAVAADLADHGSLAISAARFDENTAAEEGGAVFTRPGGPVLIATSIVKGNTAPIGAGFMLIGLAGDQDKVANTVFFANKATGSGATVVANQVALVNVTIARNEGGGLGDGTGSRNLRDFVNGFPTTSMRNVVLADNAPANCVGHLQVPAGGVNLQSPGDVLCPGVSLVAEPLLDSFFAPLPGSPAAGTAELAPCLTPPVNGRDLLFQKRGVKGICSIGALEMAPVKEASRLARRRQGNDQHPTSPTASPKPGHESKSNE